MHCRKKYLDYLDFKFSESNISNLIIYDEFLNGDIDQNIFSYYLPKDVHLLAVSKGHPSTAIRPFANAGQIDFGESIVQEALLRC